MVGGDGSVGAHPRSVLAATRLRAARPAQIARFACSGRGPPAAIATLVQLSPLFPRRRDPARHLSPATSSGVLYAFAERRGTGREGHRQGQMTEQPPAVSPSRELFCRPGVAGKTRRAQFRAQTACGLPAGGCLEAERRKTEMTQEGWAEEQRSADRPDVIGENQSGGAVKIRRCSGAKLERG